MKIVKAQPLSEYRVDLAFDNGVHGVVDLADYAGAGVFEAWLAPGFFEQMTVAPDGGLAWPGDLDLCPDAIYLRLTGKAPEDIFPALRHQPVYA